MSDADRRGVVDPMSSTINRVGGNGDPVSPLACGRKVAVFDGRVRYDLRSEFKRIEMVKAERGYQGPAVVCAVYFEPISGYVPDRPVIKYLVALRDAEVWLAPISGTRVLVPFRFSMPTPLGMGVLQATQFVAAAQAGPSQRQRENPVIAAVAQAPYEVLHNLDEATPATHVGSCPSASPLSTGGHLLTRRGIVIRRRVNVLGAKTTQRNRALHPIWCSTAVAAPYIAVNELEQRRESPIRPRFVPDSFHMLSTGLSSVAL